MKFKYLGLLFVGMIIAILYFYFNHSTFFLKCPLYSTTGVYCPGCGSQRAFHDLLHFDFMGVVKQNILFLFGILLTAYYFIIIAINKLFDKNVKSFLSHKKAPIIILVFLIIFWVLRNIPVYPFTLLAPR